MQRKKRAPRPKRPLNPEFDRDAWVPKTVLSKKVKDGDLNSLDEVLKTGTIMERQIIDFLIPDLKVKIVDVKKTTRVTRSGRHFSYRVTAIVGDGNGHIGVGTGKNIERLNAQTKAIQNAKRHMIIVKRGCGSWECNCDRKHSIPFKSIGKCASLRVELLPAPNGVGLAVSDSIKPVFELAGITDIWSKTRGATDTKLNFVRATIDSLRKLSHMKLSGKLESEESLD